jgi:DNA polymerase-3 subunit alpha
MDQIRPFVKSNAAVLLQQVNNRLIADIWNKYCNGSISKWEMSALSCYIHGHELSGLNLSSYGIDDFNTLSEIPEIDRYIPIKGKMIPIFKLHRIAGTVLDKDKAKKTVTLLTTHGVVTVKIYGVFAEYDKQISERDNNGKKHVLRKSEFTRGNLIIVTGIRDGEHEFRAKTYKNTPFHHVETITDIKDGEIIINNRND